MLARPVLRLALAELALALAANPWEEAGWRGFALPRLQKRHSDFFSSLVVGSLWGLWHLPLFFWAGSSMSQYPMGVWIVGVAAEAFVYAWMSTHTRGSLLTASLFHISTNTLGAVLLSFETRGYTIVVCLVALALLGFYGPGRFRKGTLEMVVQSSG